MAYLSGVLSIGDIDLYASASTPLYLPGTLAHGALGKAFRYVYTGASALVVGNLIQSSANATITDFDGLAVPTARAAGVTQVTLTLGSSAVTANQFNGGSMVVSTSSTASANIGEEYTIVSHTAASGGAAITINLDRPLRTAWTTATTTVSLRRSNFSGVIQCPTTLTGTAVGVAIYPIPSTSYGWIQTKGVCGALSDASTYAVGSMLSNSAATPGAVGVVVAATARAIIGYAMGAQISTHAQSVHLLLD